MDDDDIKKRLEELRIHLGLKRYQFEELLGLPQGCMSNKLGLSKQVMVRIKENMPSINMNWLLVGEQPMLLGDEITTKNATTALIRAINQLTQAIKNK